MILDDINKKSLFRIQKHQLFFKKTAEKLINNWVAEA